MNQKLKKILLFFFGCVIVRSLFVLAAKKANKENLKYFGYIGLVISLLFVYAYFKNNKVGAFGGPAWWHKFRIVHALLYFVFGIMAINGNEDSYLVLLADLILGLLLFSNHYLFVSN